MNVISPAPVSPVEAGFSLPGITVLVGDARERLRDLSAGSVQTCVTSPPYFNLRNYQAEGQIGLEETPDLYVEKLVCLFHEVRRVLRDDGTLWLNLGDSGRNKNLLMIPARVALALQADGWTLRSEIIWAKPNPMPESVRDRPTNAHEKVFLFAKSERYYYDIDAVREPHCKAVARSIGKANIKVDLGQKTNMVPGKVRQGNLCRGGNNNTYAHPLGRNLRNVWAITPKPFKGAHFATFPPDLPERCILAGSRPGDTVLDPFAGSGTTGMVAKQLGRKAVLIELNPDYAGLIHKRVSSAQPRLIP